MKAAAFAVLTMTAGCATPAQGGEQPWRRTVLVELFTSQGCSSCPPADRLVRELPQLGLGHDRVIPLTFHVDYWDELGWKDPFAAPAFTARQRWYAETGHLRGPDGITAVPGLYTPQMIVDGQVHFSGARRALAIGELRRAGSVPARVRLAPHISVADDHLEITVDVAAIPPFVLNGDWHLRVALAARSARTPVLAGENGGETLEEAAVVRLLADPIAITGPQVHLTLARPPGALSPLELVTFVQSTRTLEVAGVAALDSLAP